MMKKSIKYLLIASVNFAILIWMMSIWTDKLAILFYPDLKLVEFLKILGLAILSLVAMRILVYYFRKKGIINYRIKLMYATFLMIGICSFLYVSYSIRIVQNSFLNAEIREKTWMKVKNGDKGRLGIFVNSLSYKEYNEISKTNWFPEIPKTAENISFIYYNGGFQGDYTFNLDYDVPVSENVQQINLKKDQHLKSITVKIIGNRKKVTYEEGES